MFLLNLMDSAELIVQVTRLREYQGVDQDFDEIARRYHDLVTVSISWAIA